MARGRTSEQVAGRRQIERRSSLEGCPNRWPAGHSHDHEGSAIAKLPTHYAYLNREGVRCICRCGHRAGTPRGRSPWPLIALTRVGASSPPSPVDASVAAWEYDILSPSDRPVEILRSVNAHCPESRRQPRGQEAGRRAEGVGRCGPRPCRVAPIGPRRGRPLPRPSCKPCCWAILRRRCRPGSIAATSSGRTCSTRCGMANIRAPAPHRRHGDVDDQLTAIPRPRARAAVPWPSSRLNIRRPDDCRVPDRAYPGMARARRSRRRRPS
jgi:hypothetical protein